MSADVFVHAINIVASSLNDTTSSMNNVEYATLIKRCQGYYATARDLFGVKKADKVAFALLNAAAMHKDSFTSIGLEIIRGKIREHRRLSGREAKILSDTAGHFGLQSELALFWSEMHKKHGKTLELQSTAIRSLLESHIITNNATGTIFWSKRIIETCDRANIPPATLKALLLRYTHSQCTLCCLKDLLPLSLS